MKKFLIFVAVAVVVCVAAYIVGVLGLVWLVTPAGECGPDCEPVVEQNVEQPIYVVKVKAKYNNHMDIGSGVLVRGDLILTAYHNIRDSKDSTEIEVQFADGTTRIAKVARKNSEQDLALLKIKTVLYQTARPAIAEPANGECVTICGFKKGNKYTQVSGAVVGRRSPTRNSDNTLFVVNNKCFPGMSGGPVIDSEGFVVGTLFGTRDYANCTGLEVINLFLTNRL